MLIIPSKTSQNLSYDDSNLKVLAGATVYHTGDREYALLFCYELK